MTTSDSSYVLDASVVLKWYLLDEADVARAHGFYRQFVAGNWELRAPSYIRYEVANGIEAARLQGRVAAEVASTQHSRFLGLGFFEKEDPNALIEAAIGLSRELSIAPYDALYLALAEATGIIFVTADHRLYRRIAGRVPYARWIGDVPLP